MENMKAIKEKNILKNGIIDISCKGWSDFTFPSQKISLWGTKEAIKQKL